MRIKVCIFEDEVRKNQERLERLAVLKFKADRQYSSLMESLTSEELSSLREEITHEESVTKDYLEVMRTTKKELGSLKHASDFLSEKYKLDEKTLKEIKTTIQTEISKLEMKADFYKNIISAIDSHLEDNRKKKLERQQ